MDSRQEWNRRALLAGLTAAASAGPAAAQIFSAMPRTGDESRILSNLVTRMAARVGVNGRERYAFVIDTGAGRTSVSDRVASELGLPSGPEVLVHGVTSAVMTPTVRLDRLEFGGRTFNDLICPVFPANQLAADGLVGLDVLSRFRLTFDLGSLRVTLAPSGGSVVETSETFYEATRMRRAGRSTAVARFGQLVLLSAQAEGRPIDLFVDSGAQYSIGNLALMEMIDRYLPRSAPRERIQVFGVIGQSIEARIGEIRDLRIARHALGVTPLLFADLHAFRVLGLSERPAMLMGADLLTRFRQVGLDYGRGRMIFSGLRKARPFEGYPAG